VLLKVISGFERHVFAKEIGKKSGVGGKGWIFNILLITILSAFERKHWL